MAKKKEIKKKKKPEIQEFITKVKELRKMTEPVTFHQFSETEENSYPLEFEWQGESYKIQKLIGIWKIEESDDPETLELSIQDILARKKKKREIESKPKKFKSICYRVELENGFQVDLLQDLLNSGHQLIGIEQGFYEITRKN